MVEFEVRNYDGQVYFKEELKKILNTATLRVIADAETAIIFSENIPLERVKNSLKVILRDIDNRIVIEKETKKMNNEEILQEEFEADVAVEEKKKKASSINKGA